VSFILSTDGLLYNAPALLILGWFILRRPILGAILAVGVWFRVVEGILDLSMHAFIASVSSLVLPGWERLLGVGLGAYTAWWYLFVWAAPIPFWKGIFFGALLGIAGLSVYWVAEDHLR